MPFYMLKKSNKRLSGMTFLCLFFLLVIVTQWMVIANFGQVIKPPTIPKSQLVYTGDAVPCNGPLTKGEYIVRVAN